MSWGRIQYSKGAPTYHLLNYNNTRIQLYGRKGFTGITSMSSMITWFVCHQIPGSRFHRVLKVCWHNGTVWRGNGCLGQIGEQTVDGKERSPGFSCNMTAMHWNGKFWGTPRLKRSQQQGLNSRKGRRKEEMALRSNIRLVHIWWEYHVY